MRSAWRSAWREPGFRISVVAALAVAVGIAVVLPFFFEHIGRKAGVRPWDPLIPFIGPVDVTWTTFFVLYGGVAFTVIRAMPEPRSIERGIHAYVLLQLFRMICMELVTLEPPQDIIPLVDPVTVVFYPDGIPFLKDLFFSGHTATLALMACISRGAAARWTMVAATAAVGALVVIQHVHWTLDVLAAPLFVWLAWRLSSLSVRRSAGAAA